MKKRTTSFCPQSIPLRVAAAAELRTPSRFWCSASNPMKTYVGVLVGILAAASGAAAQSNDSRRLPFAQSSGPAAPPAVITLQDALERARMLDADVQSAVTDVRAAGEDRQQAKSSLLPSVSNSTQYLGTQGNGLTPSGRYVSN